MPILVSVSKTRSLWCSCYYYEGAADPLHFAQHSNQRGQKSPAGELLPKKEGEVTDNGDGNGDKQEELGETGRLTDDSGETGKMNDVDTSP